MAAGGRRKSGLDNNAAYAASQPLFHALRAALDNLETQRTQLGIARDIVQNLHVKIVNENPQQDRSYHDQYVESVVAAWQSANEVYADLFKHVTDITAANPAEGRPASESHNQFEAMLKSASEARDAAAKFILVSQSVRSASDTSTSTDTSDSGSGSDSDSDSSENDSNENEGQNDVSQDASWTTAIEVNSNGKRPLAGENGIQPIDMSQPPSKIQKSQESDFIPLDDTHHGSGGTKASGHWKTMTKQQRRDVQKSRKLEKARKARANAAARKLERKEKKRNAAAAAAAAANSNRPEVEYEDVSLEAAARLKNKEAAKKAKQDGKKRKRESTDSVGRVGDDATRSTESLDISAIDKPDKKKAKTVNGFTNEQTLGPKIINGRGKRKHKQAADGQQNGEEAEQPRKKKNKDKYNKETRKLAKQAKQGNQAWLHRAQLG